MSTLPRLLRLTWRNSEVRTTNIDYLHVYLYNLCKKLLVWVTHILWHGMSDTYSMTWYEWHIIILWHGMSDSYSMTWYEWHIFYDMVWVTHILWHGMSYTYSSLNIVANSITFPLAAHSMFLWPRQFQTSGVLASVNQISCSKQSHP
jgi:hypothetical protein